MEVIIRPNTEAAADLVARVIAKELRAKPDLVLGLATGRTMVPVYARLVWMHREEGLDFSGCRTFNLDEYVGLPANNPHSYRHYMDQQLFHKVNIDPRNTHVPDGTAANLEAECADYEKRITECGGIDLQLLGIGHAGHLAFNEPVSALRSRTRVKVLTPTTLRQNASLFGGAEKVPRRAITVGVGTILDSRRCLLLATGTEKAWIFARAVEGPLTSMISATALQLHPACTVVADAAAGSQLTETEYYNWIFENEPQWAPFRQPTPARNGHAHPEHNGALVNGVKQ